MKCDDEKDNFFVFHSSLFNSARITLVHTNYPGSSKLQNRTQLENLHLVKSKILIENKTKKFNGTVKSVYTVLY